MNTAQLHPTQVSILHSLRYAPSERFNALMKPTGHTSDTFKFHVRKLIKQGCVEKRNDGRYQLTAFGKEFANNLEESQRTLRKQPTLSVFLVVPRPGSKEAEFLMFKRARNPFIGYWTCITDPVRWGESFESRASKRLEMQTGLQADFTVHSLRRIRNYASETEQLLEDMFFVVMLGSNPQGQLKNDYPGGKHAWLTLGELKQQGKYYDSVVDVLEDLRSEKTFKAYDLSHPLEEY